MVSMSFVILPNRTLLINVNIMLRTSAACTITNPSESGELK